MFIHILWRAIWRRKRRWWLILTCISVLIVIFFIVDVAHITKTTAEHRQRQNRIHQYFQNASRGSHTTSSLISPIEQPTCIHPELPLWSPDVQNYLEPVQPIECTPEPDWVYTWAGKFMISEVAIKEHGEIKCVYIPIVNNNDSFVIWKSIVPMLNGSDLVSDAFKVICKAADGQRYANIHPCIMPINLPRDDKILTQNNKETPNVLIFGFDSLSRQMFKRLLPKTHKFVTQTLGASLLEGYNIVGDGTPQALMPILTGKQETEIPEVRRGKPGAKPVDEVLTFIWKRFERHGYITQWGEDMANVGTFNYRMLGFKDKPVHHYMRPFYLAAIPMYHLFKGKCLGSRPRHKVFLDWLKEGLTTNRGRKFFTFGFFSEFSHENNNPVSLTDADNVEFLKYILDHGFLDDTVLLVLSDHGIRYGNLRHTEQGKLEERMPYVAVRLPPRFEMRYPDRAQSLRINAKRLVTPFDLHESLLEILGEEDTSFYDKTGRGRSIFHDIPLGRTCADAGIEPHWCACLNWKQESISSYNVSVALNAILSTMNDLLEDFSNVCQFLVLSNITKAVTLETNEAVLKFNGSKDLDGRVADLSDPMKSTTKLYQITFVTDPGAGLFEATATMDIITGTVTSTGRDISRLNRYGDTPHCIIDTAPRLRPYCVCKQK